MIPHARQIFYASAPDKHYRMLLQVMPHPRNIGVDLVAVGEPHARNLAKRRVGFLGRRSLHLGADPAFLRATLQRRRAYLVTLLHARASYQLINRGHDYFYSCKARCCAAPVCKLFSGPFPLLKQTPQGRLSPLGELSLLTGIMAACQSPAAAGASTGTAFSNSSSAGKPSTRVSIRLYLGRPVPAGIRRPIITFSLSPTSRSTLPLIAASVSTLVVSWNEAAEMKLSVESEALVIPSNSGSAIAGSPPLVKTRPFSSSKRHFSVGAASWKSISPTSLIRTRRSISPRIVRISCGFDEPSINGSPALIMSPSCTPICLPLGIGYSRGSPTSGVTTTLRLPLVSLPNETWPSISEMTANSFGLRASNNSATRGRPPVISFVFVVSRGILAITSPGYTCVPSGTLMYAPTGKK